MDSNLKFEFTINKDTYTVIVKRDFAAGQDLVWDAFTKPEILDQWWAPKPWMSETKYMDFKVGGRRLYAMLGPEGEEHWSIMDFTAITPKANFKYLDAFCDENENLSNEMPRSEWNLDFEGDRIKTTVTIEIRHKSLSDLEMIISMGFKEGFTMALGNLDEVLAMLK